MFIKHVNEIENLLNKRVIKIWCDNGTGNLNKDTYNFARRKGIQIKPYLPYVHELNGTAEMYNRSIMDISRYLLAEANVELKFWPEIVCTAAYLKNRTLANTSLVAELLVFLKKHI